MTARLRISADDQEGVLQRVIFEFSRRNISIEKLSFSRECSFNKINVDVKNDGDALRAIKSIKRIQGVVDAEHQLGGSEAEGNTAQTKKEMNPQERLG